MYHLPVYGLPVGYGFVSMTTNTQQNIAHTYQGAGCIIYDPVCRSIFLGFDGSNLRELGGGLNGKATLEEAAANNAFLQSSGLINESHMLGIVRSSNYFDLNMGSKKYRFYICNLHNFDPCVAGINNQLLTMRYGNISQLVKIDSYNVKHRSYQVIAHVQHAITECLKRGYF